MKIIFMIFFIISCNHFGRRLLYKLLDNNEYFKMMQNGSSTPVTGNLSSQLFTSFNEEEKIELISKHFRQIMTILGLDLTDDSLQGTPHRVAKMFVKETFSGLNPENEPHITLFENKFDYGQMLIEKNITVYSCCEHHFVPIIGKAHVAYFAK